MEGIVAVKATLLSTSHSFFNALSITNFDLEERFFSGHRAIY